MNPPTGPGQGGGFPQGGVFNAALDAVVVMDHEGIVLDFNPSAERTFGLKREDVVGKELADLIIPPALRDAHRSALNRYVVTGTATILDQRLELIALRADGTEFPVELAVTRVPETDPPIFAGFIRDMTAQEAAAGEHVELLARERLARAEAERAREHFEFLAEVGPAFDQSLEVDETLETLANLAIPVLADVCVVDYLRDGRAMESAAAIAALDSRAARVIKRAWRAHERRSDSLSGEVAQLLEGASIIRVPLTARGRRVGAVVYIRLRNRPGYDEDTSFIAREVAARYMAAGEGIEVGGDFYDCFATGRGDWALVIGDVCGKGPEAAALTALARYTIRAAAAEPEMTTAGVLGRLNEAILRDAGLGDRFLTAIFARLEVTDGAHRLELASAGHTVPLVARAGGGTDYLPARGSLLGVIDNPVFTIAETTLNQGDALILYTDGLLDALAPARFITEEELAEAAEANLGAGAEGLAGALQSLATGGGSVRDDIAILVAELAPERRRRPRLPPLTLSAVN
jgi:PAS domain S-box-containing protein